MTHLSAVLVDFAPCAGPRVPRAPNYKPQPPAQSLHFSSRSHCLSRCGFVPYGVANSKTNTLRVDQSDVADSDAKKRTPCFIEDFVDVVSPFGTLRARFSGDGQWLAPLATVATQDGDTFQMRIGPSWAAGIVTREVNVMLWPPRERGYALVRCLTWTPSDWQSLFPFLEGDLELAPIGPNQCRISLAATYTPALGKFGAHVDRALLHHVAASTVRSFLTQIATKLQSNTDEA